MTNSNLLAIFAKIVRFSKNYHELYYSSDTSRILPEFNFSLKLKKKFFKTCLPPKVLERQTDRQTKITTATNYSYNFLRCFFIIEETASLSHTSFCESYLYWASCSSAIASILRSSKAVL
jgi:hypothetical protein